MKKRRTVVLHPFLFASYPILRLISINLNEIRLNDTYRSLAVSLAVAAALLVLLRLIFRSWELAALATSLFVILFFAYGHIYILLNDRSNIDVRHRHVLLPFGALFSVAIAVALRHRDQLSGATRALNWISIIAITIPLVGISTFGFRRASMPTVGAFDVIADWGRLPSVDTKEAPDIYYIVLDEYADREYLDEHFGYDNSAFEDALVENGFYIADESLANYAHTALSLASALNMTYVQDLRIDLDRDGYPSGLSDQLEYSLVRQQLEALGYSIVSIDSGWQWSQWRDADQFITADGNQSEALLTLNRFEDMLVQTSGGRLVLFALLRFQIIEPTLIIEPNYTHRQTILAQFDTLNKVAGVPGPKFVYVHILSPHRPFVFDASGEEPSPEDASSFAGRNEQEKDGELYLAQLEYVTKRVLDAVESIVSGSRLRPVVIIQSDTGSSINLEREDPSYEDLYQRLLIPNAYLVPDACLEILYPEISPVNSFRVIFNCVFSARYNLLPDYSYFSGFEDVDNFDRVDHLLR